MNNAGGDQAKRCPITQSFTEQKVHVACADNGAFPFGQSVDSPTDGSPRAGLTMAPSR